MARNCTFPICPTCGGRRCVDRDDHGGRRWPTEPCKDCNGNRVVSPKKYKEIMDRRSKESESD